MIPRTRPGIDTRAIQEILAARAISNKFDDGVLYGAAVDKANAIKIIQASGQVSQISYDPAAQRIAYASTDGSVHLLDAQTGQTIGQPLSGGTGDWELTVQFSPDGRLIAAGGEGGKVKL